MESGNNECTTLLFFMFTPAGSNVERKIGHAKRLAAIIGANGRCRCCRQCRSLFLLSSSFITLTVGHFVFMSSFYRRPTS